MSINSNHYRWVDLAKAASIFGVVFIHCGLFFDSLNVGYYFRFCVPLFIIISFFLAERLLIDRAASFSKNKFWKKRLPRLIYPYIFWSLIYTIGKFLLGITQSLEFSPIYGWQGQYYFMILLQLTLLYPWIRLIKINLAVLISSGILTFIFIYIPFSYLKISNFIAARGEAPFFYWLFYVLFAIYIARHYDETRVYIKAKFPHFQVPFLFILPLLSCLETVLLNHNILNFYLSPGEYSRFSVILISPVLFLLFLSLNFTSKNILQNTIVDLMSKWSLGIFCLNPIVISSIYILGKNIQFNTYFSDIPDLLQLLIRLLLAIVTCIVSILLCYLISLVGGKGLVK